MIPIEHPSTNNALGLPPGIEVSEGRQILPQLPITVAEVGGQPAIMSFWTLDPEELKLVNAGKPVILIVYGDHHPLVSVCVEAEGSGFVTAH